MTMSSKISPIMASQIYAAYGNPGASRSRGPGSTPSLLGSSSGDSFVSSNTLGGSRGDSYASRLLRPC